MVGNGSRLQGVILAHQPVRHTTSGSSRKYVATGTTRWHTAEIEHRSSMAPQQKAAFRPLTRDEHTSLKRTAKAHSERLDQVRRAAALLAVIVVWQKPFSRLI